jgi:uncharacterized protein (TIGR02145 family)
LTTGSITGITHTAADAGGNITSDGGSEVTARGVCWGTSQNPSTGSSKTSDGTGTGSFTSSITGLTANTTYYVRAYATNSEGTSYGNEVSFPTSQILLATLTTTTVTSITTTTAVSGGDITSDGGGAITARGVCWGTATAPLATGLHTTETGTTGTFASNLTGLTANTKYYIRAYAINGAGTAYGDEKSFTTEQLKDADGNFYSTVTIGTQVWMVENLRTTKYNDNTAIPLVTDNIAWSLLTSPGYCWYDNDATTYKTHYGALYNWYAVNTGKLCPAGWHVPSHTEWSLLVTYLGGEGSAGTKLREAGTAHWIYQPSPEATNETGFTALPGGARETNCYTIGQQGFWWSSTEADVTSAWCRYLIYSDIRFSYQAYSKLAGYSVRCIKD